MSNALSPQPGKQALAAQMEVDVMIYGGSAGCLDMHTEYLTSFGWKELQHYTEGDDVYTYNSETGEFCFQSPEEYIKLPCEDLYRLEGNQLDMVVSEEHCMFYEDPENGECESLFFDIAEDINKHPEKFTFKDGYGEKKFVEKLSYYKSLDGFKYCFNVPNGLFLARRNGHTFITGNSGKSRLLLLKAGYYAHNDPNFEGVIFRRTTKPLSAAGGLFTEAKKLFAPLGVTVREQAMEIFFHGNGGKKSDRKGGNLKFTHLEHEKDAEGNHQGLQYSFVGFDELTHFELSQFLYLIGRMRSSAEGDSFLLATTNPSYDSWVYHWCSWYLTEEGYFDDNKKGKVRYFVIVDEQPVFADTQEELARDYHELCYVENPLTGEEQYVPPMSFCFLGGTIFDNPALIKANPKYLSALKAQSKVNRARLLDGCWHSRPEGSNFIMREWFHKLDKRPLGGNEARAWDLGASEPSDKNRHPDPTTSVKMIRTKDEGFVIVGDYDPLTKDDKTQIMGRVFKRPGERDQAMIRQAKLDGSDCIVVQPQDPGASGAHSLREITKMFMQEGYIVKKDPMPGNKSKLKKFEPFSSAVQNGLVSIVESTFNKETLEYFYKELEGFDGERSTATKKDDMCDCCSSVFSYLAQTRVHRPFTLPNIASPTKLSSFRQGH